jgi:hypothetical protein
MTTISSIKVKPRHDPGLLGDEQLDAGIICLSEELILTFNTFSNILLCQVAQKGPGLLKEAFFKVG